MKEETAGRLGATRHPVDKAPDRLEIERRVLARWESEKVFDELRDRTKDGVPFSFLDGPITANSPMGVHHAWGRTLKDIIQRYQAMNGRTLRWQNGFDCQGLWVEVGVEKSLGFDSKREIEAYGLDRFATACRDRVAGFAEQITEQSRRLGMWMDWDRSYYTLTDTNIEYIWAFLAECHRRGWLYRGHRLMPWCTRCGTSLSQHELIDSYAELTHPSLFVRLPLLDRPGEYLAVWTTTPWTLPANVAVAVAPGARYVFLEGGGSALWVAEERLDALPFSGMVVGSARGAELIGRRYVPPFPDLEAARGVEHRVIGWDEVRLDEGTGLVHIAPGCGAEDFALATQRQLPVLSPINEDGRYRAGYGWLTGREVGDIDAAVEAALRANGWLAAADRIVHRYPVCWRCSTPLVHRVVDEWFIDCAEVREPMRKAAAEVEWRPSHAGKRMDDWLRNMGDWCISRKRYWGLPLPFYFCSSGHLTVIGSRRELEERTFIGKESLRSLRELHRPWIDEITVACVECGDAAERIPEVGDCWLDAGIVAFSTLGWQNPVARPGGYAEGAGVGLTAADLPDHDHWQRWFPADSACEMVEQIRLWFYATLFMSVVLAGRAPYRRALIYSKVNDETGREMHASWGNAILFDEVVEDVGADTMRWLFASQPPSRDLRFGYAPLRAVTRRFLTFWNSYIFFLTYADLAEFQPRAELRSRGPEPDAPRPIDRWLLARTQELIRHCRNGMDTLDTPAVTRAFEEFADDLSHWYVRRNRDRFWDGRDEAAYETLWYALVTAVRLVAPIMPFVTDEMWANLMAGEVADAPGSVHLDSYPEVVPAFDDPALLDDMTTVRRLAELGRAARSSATIRRRQPVAAMYLVNGDPEARRRMESHLSLIATECNAKQVHVVAESADFATVEVVPDFRKLGPKLRGHTKRVAELLRAGEFARAGRSYQVGEWTVDAAEVSVRTRARPGFAVAERDGWVVGLDTEITPELALEGQARDLVREIQRLRKDLDLPVTARIEVSYPPAAREVIDVFGEWIGEQTLALSLREGGELGVIWSEPR